MADDAAWVRRKAPTVEDFVARAEALLPALRERAAAAERNRRLPDETIDAFRTAEFHKIMQPVAFGGYGLGIDVAAEVIRTLATACGSSAWVAHLFIMHNWLMSLFPLKAQEDYWAASKDAMCATASFSLRGALKAVDGGFRISGRWKFASGSDFADWFVVMKPTADCFDWFLLPRSDVEIVDDWFVSGLCATGSKDLVLDDVFVPAHRVLEARSLVEGRVYGRLAMPQQGMWGIPAALLGMATGLTEAFRQSMVGKRAMVAGENQVERVANQLKLTEALSDIHAAELVMRHRLETLAARGWKDEAEYGPEAFASERDAAYVARLAAKVANSLAISAGANSVYLSNPIQRFQRDIMVGVTHVSLVWEEIAEGYGRAAWGLPRKVPTA